MEVKYRKKPVVVSTIPVREALRCASSDWPGLPKWLLVAYEEGKVVFGVGWVSISTAEGQMRGDLDDILIQGVKGEIYPCKPDIFAATYEPAEETDSAEVELPARTKVFEFKQDGTPYLIVFPADISMAEIETIAQSKPFEATNKIIAIRDKGETNVYHGTAQIQRWLNEQNRKVEAYAR